MLVLAVETATDLSGCALVDETGLLAEVRLLMGRRHAESVAPQMRFVCEQAGVSFSDVDAVAVDVGPGLYTGLRVGLAAAQALAFALDVGVAEVSSLEALACGAGSTRGAGTHSRCVLSVLDARRGEVFWAWSSVTANNEVEELSRPSVGAPQVLAEQIAERASARLDGAKAEPDAPPQGGAPSEGGMPPVARGELSGNEVMSSGGGAPPHGCEPILLVGEGALRYADLLNVPPHTELAAAELSFPSPAVVALLGRVRAVAGDVVSPEAVQPVYLRSHDAVLPASSSAAPSSAASRRG